jgi:hypothetical protein
MFRALSRANGKSRELNELLTTLEAANDQAQRRIRELEAINSAAHARIDELESEQSNQFAFGIGDLPPLLPYKTSTHKARFPTFDSRPDSSSSATSSSSLAGALGEYHFASSPS